MLGRTFLALAFASALTGFAAAEALAADAIGTIDKLQGPAEARQGGAARPLALNAPLQYGDQLRTGPGARLHAVLADGSEITLGENAKLTIDDFVYTPGKAGGTLALNAAAGAFLYVGGKVEGPTGGNVSIKTAVGTLGIRGTTVWGGSIDDGFGVLVLKGTVRCATKHGAVTLKDGQGTMIRGAKAPTAAAPWPEDRTKRAVASISFQ